MRGFLLWFGANEAEGKVSDLVVDLAAALKAMLKSAVGQITLLAGEPFRHQHSVLRRVETGGRIVLPWETV